MGDRRDLRRIAQLSLPTGPGQRHRCLFALARRALALGGGQRLTTADELTLFGLWWRRAKLVVTTKDRDASLGEFLVCCDRATTPLDDPVFRAADRAKKTPLPKLPGRVGRDARRVAALCREMQREFGDCEFGLSGRSTADALRLRSHQVASKILKLLCSLKVIRLITPGDRKTRLATRYRYIWPDLSVDTSV